MTNKLLSPVHLLVSGNQGLEMAQWSTAVILRDKDLWRYDVDHVHQVIGFVLKFLADHWVRATVAPKIASSLVL